MPQKVLTSKAFSAQARKAGKEFRDGTVGEALDDLYEDIDAGFTALEQDAVAALTDNSGAGGIGNSTIALVGVTNTGNEAGPINGNFSKLNAQVDLILVALRAAGIIKD
jgi:hypothetical protein